MNCPALLTLSLGNLEISEISAAVLITVSLVFLVSFVIVSLKNDSKGMMDWMFDNKANEKRWVEEANVLIDSHEGMPNGKIQSNVL